MKKIVSIISTFVGCLALLFVIASCDNTTNNENTGNQPTSNATTSNPDNSGVTGPSNPGTDDVFYTVTFKDYDGTVIQTSSVEKGDTPTYYSLIPTRENDDNYSYTFNGWNPSLSIVNSDAVYVATYTKSELPYNITIDLDGGSCSATKLQFKTDRISKDMLPFDVKKKGYVFKGYELSNIKVYDELGNVVNNYQLSSSMTFKAIYEEAVTLTILYSIYNPKTGDLINKYSEKPTDMGTVSETNSYNFNTYVDLFANANEGYTFLGWYNEGQVLSNEKDYKYMMWNEDFTIEARFEYTLYDFNVWSNNTDLGQVMIRNGNSQTFYDEQTLKEFYSESVTVVAYSKADTRFLGWYDEKNELVSPNAVYTFNMANENYTLEAKWNRFNITYDLDGGINDINNPASYNVDMQNIKLLDPTKQGYTFLGWQYKGNIITSINTSNICHMELKALWTYYTLTTNVNNIKAGSVSSYNDTKVTKDIAVTITATTNPGYTFVGWYDGDNLISEKPSYSFTMPAKNLSYTAKWSANTNTTYKVEHYLQNLDDDNYPNTPYETDNLTGTTDTLTNGNVKTYEGFTSPSVTQVNINGNGNTVIKLYYTRNSYTVTLNKDIDKAGTVIGGGSYKYGKEITVEAATNDGYTFVGWYKDNIEYITDASFDYKIGTSNVTFEAKYSINKYTITIDNQAEGITISGITSGNEYEYDSQIILSTTNIPSGHTIRWERSDGVVYVGDSYLFKVPSTNITIVTIIRPYTKNNNKIYFGTYPQTKVTNKSLINELNEKVGDLPTSTDSKAWIDYNYYMVSGITPYVSSYMYYQDIDYNNDGTFDYRGVYFTEYRPYIYTNNCTTSYQDDNGYSTNTIYWFSYEPIEWNILSESNGKALIIANLILDSQDYYKNYSSESFSHNGGDGYSSNYELSNIRKFLNDNFYNTAFNDLQKALIEITEVDNSAESTNKSPNSFACNNTNDKMFLLSYKEATTYYTSNSAREAKGSDYAKIQGLFVYESSGYSSWFLRSPSADKQGGVSWANFVFYYDGRLENNEPVYHTDCGVRPACWITL